MADLLFKFLTTAMCLVLFLTGQAFAFESSFPFPFEFGHSSDIYLDVKKPETKEIRQQRQLSMSMLKEKGIKTDHSSILKYIKRGETGTIKLLLDAGFNPNARIYANYLLYYAAKYNQKEIIQILLKEGADPNQDFSSPLRFSILHKDKESAKLLVDYGANVNYTEMLTDETLLYTSLKKKEYDIAMLLLSKGAKIDAASYKLIKNKNLERKIGIFLD